MTAGRSALVTGASRGIGAGIARALAHQGFGLTIAGRDESRLQSVADEVARLGSPSVAVIAGDAGADGHAARLVDAHWTRYGSMDCLVLNAGVGTAGPVDAFPVKRLNRTLDVNVRATFELLQAALPLLREAAARDPDLGARVVALSSITGVYAEPGLAAYGASKAALVSLIETFNAEESANGVSGTAIAPGYVDTDMSDWMKDQIPSEQMIPVEDVVGLAMFLVGISARSVISKVVMHRAGTGGYVA